MRQYRGLETSSRNKKKIKTKKKSKVGTDITRERREGDPNNSKMRPIKQTYLHVWIEGIKYNKQICHH